MQVKFVETAWKVDLDRRELTDGFRVFRFHPIGVLRPGRNHLVPVHWEKQNLAGDWERLSDSVLEQDLNTGLALVLSDQGMTY